MRIGTKALVAALALSFSSISMAAGTIKIGLIGPYTGGSSPMGVSLRDGARLAAAEINHSGGLLGKKIQLIERDDQARNERGIQIAQELINREHITAAVGIANTGVVLASRRYFQQAQVPFIESVATGSQNTNIRQDIPNAKDNYIFRVSAYDTIQARMIANEAARRHLKKVAILADSTNYGQLGRADLEKALAADHVKAVAVEKYNIGDVDMTPQLLRSKNAGAQAVLTYGIGPELAQIANGMVKLGYKVPMFGSWTLSMSNFIDNAGKNGEGALMPETFIQVANTPKRKAFIDAYLKTFHPAKGRIPSPVSAAQTYDAMMILAAAIRQAGSTDGPKIRAALENLKAPVPGVITTYNHPYTHDNHEAIKPQNVVFGMVKNGVVVYAK